ncbi:MAG: hypothetical protein JO301_05320 [Chitinophagaceae bacterium]|nr:hypothetical protein [Chitinophagaceae bacterium]
MKKYLITTLMGIAALATVQAQEYKLAKSSGKLVLHLASATVESTTGNEIIFSNDRSDKESDERAKGLRPISGSGYTDNTGLGISVTEKSGAVEVNQVNQRDHNIRIKVPKGVSISYEFDKVQSGKVVFSNIDNEIEVSVQYNSVKLDNVTGPLTVKTIYGGVDAKFSDNIKGPISIVSIYGHVDVAIPTTTKANIKLSASHGEILAASDLKIDLEKSGDADMISYSNNNVRGKINGGGAEISLRADYSKIYLRKSN